MGFLVVSLALWLFTFTVNFARDCCATPMAHGIERRAAVTCRPIETTRDFLFQDCIAAFNLMAEQHYSLHRVLLFGRGPNVDIRINGPPLVWEAGTVTDGLKHIVLRDLHTFQGRVRSSSRP